MTVRDVDLSRAVSHALRHEPWLYELELDEEGWAQVEQLVSALREKGENWSAVDRKAIERMIMSATNRATNSMATASARSMGTPHTGSKRRPLVRQGVCSTEQHHGRGT